MRVADARRRLMRRLPRPFARRPGPALLGCAAVLVIAAACGAIGFSATTTRWTSQASAVIVAPQSDADVVGENPLLRLDTDLVRLTPVLAEAMGSPTASMALRRQDASAPFRVDTSNAPLVRFIADASSASSARQTAAALLSVARDQLDTLQTRADADGAQRATLLTVLSPTPPVRRGATRWTVAGRAAGAVVALALLGVLVVAAVRRRSGPVSVPRPSTRRQRRLRAAADPAAPVVPRAR